MLKEFVMSEDSIEMVEVWLRELDVVIAWVVVFEAVDVFWTDFRSMISKVVVEKLTIVEVLCEF